MLQKQHQFLITLGFPPLKLDKVNNFLRSRGVDFIRIPLYLNQSSRTSAVGTIAPSIEIFISAQKIRF